MDVLVREEYQLRLTKREFTLITKALVDKLSDEVINIDGRGSAAGAVSEKVEARALGLSLLDRAVERADDKGEVLRKAYRQAEEQPDADH